MGLGCPRFTFCLTFFQSYMLLLFISGLLSYLGGMKRRASRHVMCKRDNSHFLHMYLSPLTSAVYLLVNLFEKPVHNAIRHFSCCGMIRKNVYLHPF